MRSRPDNTPEAFTATNRSATLCRKILHVNYDVISPGSRRLWSREASLNTIPTIELTLIHVAPLADNRTFSAANELSMVTTR